MLAAKDETIARAVGTASALMEDTEIRARIEAREDYYRRQRTEKAKLRKAEEEAAAAREQIAAAQEQIKVLQEELERLRKQNPT